MLEVAQQVKHNFPAFDSTYFASHIFWLIISFALFYFFVSKLVVPLIGGVLETRHDRIAADLDAASKLKIEADDLKKQLDLILNQSHDKAKNILEEAKRNAKQLAEEERKNGEMLLAKQMTESVTQINEAKLNALDSVEQIVSEVAPLLVRKILTNSGVDISEQDILNILKNVDLHTIANKNG